ncbi:TPA: hypothetical protein ACV5EY_001168 [Klebsiella aerogenes]|uniref:hypothetical protein n=1 Tax=Klebsiella TaxID=570 RepID=UPI000B40FE9C|nr:hypothetical protein [Klebsiella aerogenes]EKZ9668787.1 hypothetical protein [Klebsiella aerogenes]ELA2274654.1 hypothetical protein [Klebsiella aerogenes]MDA3992485.1 hypothetical protein [Klebsiella aerogenes]MDQ8583138.1 hypothetical protein [Klebsiella aerogenes]MEB7635935.1 hypothetical protein [Klebsiella aerogenes]
MRTSNILYVIAGIIFIMSTTTYASEKVPKGALVVRYGAANMDENYENQDGYPDNLQNVSALCSRKDSGANQDLVNELIGSDKTRKSIWKKAGATKASTLINKNAKIESDPLPKNPNHCLISNISLANIKGTWVIYVNPPELSVHGQ